MSNTTIVTALYDINRETWVHEPVKRTFTIYKNWTKGFLSLDANIVFFCDPQDLNEFLEFRKLVDPNLSKTKFISREFSSLDFYKYKQVFKNIISSKEFTTGLTGTTHPQRMYEDYLVLMLAKVGFVKETTDLNPFNSKYFMWLDAGIFRDEKIDFKSFTNIPPIQTENKLNDGKVHVVNVKRRIGSTDIVRIIKDKIQFLGGGWFAGNKEAIYWLNNKWNESVDQLIKMNLIDQDQSIMLKILIENKQKFDVKAGGWFTCRDIILGKEIL